MRQNRLTHIKKEAKYIQISFFLFAHLHKSRTFASSSDERQEIITEHDDWKCLKIGRLG